MTTPIRRPVVDVIVLHFRHIDYTKRCLESVFRLSYPAIRVILVSNGGDDDLDSLAAAVGGRRHAVVEVGSDPGVGEPAQRPQFGGMAYEDCGVFIVRTRVNRGFGGGANLGLRLARELGGSDYFWLLNNDVMVTPDAVDALVARLQKDRQIGLCGCLQLRMTPDGEPQDEILASGGFMYLPALGHFWQLKLADTGSGETQELVERKMFGVHGAALFGSADFLDRVGLVDESRYLYFEEQDWAIRARDAGFRIAYSPEAQVYHVAESSFDRDHKGSKSVVARYFMARSRADFTRRRYPRYLPSVAAFQLADALWSLLHGRSRLARFKILGFIDGLRGRWRRFPELGAVQYQSDGECRALLSQSVPDP